MFPSNYGEVAAFGNAPPTRMQCYDGARAPGWVLSFLVILVVWRGVQQRGSSSRTTMSGPVLRLRGRDHRVSGTLVMGVVNASPESFSDAGELSTVQQRLRRAESLVSSGADIVDVGGQSAITNQPEIDADLEAERVLPIVQWLQTHYPDVLVSVDTYKPAVAELCLAAGASIINDVSGLLYPGVVDICARHGAGLVVMHTRASPKVRLQNPGFYDDVGDDVLSMLSELIGKAVSVGLPRESIIVDPGPDFAKTPHQTVAVLRRIDELRAFGRPLLLALSRKDFLGAITGRSPRGRDPATHAALAYFARTPGNIARVHDVTAAQDVIATVDVLRGAREVSADYLLPDAIRHEKGPRGTA
jgi:dihydropteroate synthase